MTPRVLIVFLVAALAVATALWWLRRRRRFGEIETLQVDEMPWPCSARHGPAGPVVVVAHGFAGLRSRMIKPAGHDARPFRLHRRGLRFCRRPRPQRPPAFRPIKGHDKSALLLEDEIGRMIRFTPDPARRGAARGPGRAFDGGDPDHQQRGSQRQGRRGGRVLQFRQQGERERTENLLIVDGAWEVAALKDDAARIVALTSGAPPRERVTYGDMTQGTARRMAYAAGAEHIGVIYSHDGLTELRDWMNAVSDGPRPAPSMRRGKALGPPVCRRARPRLPLSRLLPKLRRFRWGPGLAGSGNGRSPWPAVLTPRVVEGAAPTSCRFRLATISPPISPSMAR